MVLIKKYLILLIILSSSCNVWSQIISIPDTNFEKALIDLKIDSDGIINGYILESDALVPIELVVSNYGIKDLTGISAFQNLTSLNCGNNELENIDVSSNSNLEELNCSNNNITNLILGAMVSDGPYTPKLNASNNRINSFSDGQFVTLDISHNELIDININSNKLVQLYANDNGITNSLINVTRTDSPLDLDPIINLDNNLLQINEISSSLHKNISFHNNTTLEKLILNKLPLEELSIFTESDTLNVESFGLNLLENFNVINNEKLQHLDFKSVKSTGNFKISDNDNLTSINIDSDNNSSSIITNNAKLTHITVNNNCSILNNSSLNNLDLNGFYEVLIINENINLTNLTVHNQYDLYYTIDASKNKLNNVSISSDFSDFSIGAVDLSNNELSNLNGSNIPILNFINVSNNNFESFIYEQYSNVIIDNNPFLENLYATDYTGNIPRSLSAINNPNLTCIEVADAQEANLGAGVYGSWQKDPPVLYSENCNIDLSTVIPDVNFEQALIDSGIDNDGIINQSITTADIQNITSLNLQAKNITDLTGIEDFSNLTNLNVNYNNIKKLNLTQNFALTELYCEYNQLDSINLNNNIDLKTLVCNNNLLTNIDLSKNVNIEILLCNDNNISELNIKNGNNQIITVFDSRDNLLSCIQVDDAQYSTNTWVYTDQTVIYSLDCGYTLSNDEELLFKPIYIYPNPTTNSVIIDSKLKILGGEIFSALGETVKKLGLDPKFIDLENLANGIYIIRLYLENGFVASKKLIKE